MSVRMTLAEQYPEAAKKAERHAPNMAAMLHHFHSLNDAGRAIGHKTGNAFYNLLNDNGKCPAGTSEGAAALWVKAHLGGSNMPDPDPAPQLPLQPSPQPAPDSAMTPDTDNFPPRERKAPHGAFIFPVGAIMVLAAIVLIGKAIGQFL